jgi:single-strand DNA-binding protein
MLRDFQMIGRLGKIDEINLKSSDNKGVNIRVACTTFRQGEESTSWFTVTCFGSPAASVLDYYAVGDLLFISGSIDMDTWTDKEGKERQTMKLKGFRLRRLSKGKGAEDQQGQPQQQQPQQQQPQQQQGQGQGLYGNNRQPQGGGYGPPNKNNVYDGNY